MKRVLLHTGGKPQLCPSPAEMFVGLQSVSCWEKDSKYLLLTSPLHLCNDSYINKEDFDLLIYFPHHLFFLCFVFLDESMFISLSHKSTIKILYFSYLFSVKCYLCQINEKNTFLFKFKILSVSETTSNDNSPFLNNCG